LTVTICLRNANAKSEFGCTQCRVTLTLDAEAKEGTRTDYSGEIVSENPEIVPVSDKIPIIKLAKKPRKLKLEAYARLGKRQSSREVAACFNVCIQVLSENYYSRREVRGLARNAQTSALKKYTRLKAEKLVCGTF